MEFDEKMEQDYRRHGCNPRCHGCRKSLSIGDGLGWGWSVRMKTQVLVCAACEDKEIQEEPSDSADFTSEVGEHEGVYFARIVEPAPGADPGCVQCMNPLNKGMHTCVRKP